ncbi:MAG TPA: GWxTD domain-containing protein [Candidatus Eisenbacteria bacterium]
MVPSVTSPAHCNPARRTVFVRVLVALFLAVAFAPNARAQDRSPAPGPPGVSRGGLNYAAELSVRRNAAGATVLDVLVEVPYSSLRFARDAGGWVARFDVTVLVYDRSGNQVNGDLWTIPVRSTDAARDQSRGLSIRRRYPLIVTEGRLKVDISAVQSGSGREGTWTRTIEVPRWDGTEMALSLPMFGRCDLSTATRDSSWSPPDTSWGPAFAPVVRRRYGDSQPDLCVRGEVYDQDPSDAPAYRFDWSIEGEHDRKGGSGSFEVPRVNHRGTWMVHPPIDSLSRGEWRLFVTARLANRSVRIEERFEIDESRLNVLDDADMIRGVLAYIADNEELVRLENLPVDSLATFWDQFWRRRDPSKDTPRNENRDEFMRRVEYVNAGYSIMDAGWRSDMGRIYIRYGAPDQVEKVPYTSEGPPHEIWYYTERNLRFVFVDSEGFGRFRLVGRERP